MNYFLHKYQLGFNHTKQNDIYYIIDLMKYFWPIEYLPYVSGRRNNVENQKSEVPYFSFIYNNTS